MHNRTPKLLLWKENEKIWYANFIGSCPEFQSSRKNEDLREPKPNPGLIFRALKHNWLWCECFKNIFPFVTIATVSLSRAHWQNRISSVGLSIWLPFATTVHFWPGILCNPTLSQATFANYPLIFTTIQVAHANRSIFSSHPAQPHFAFSINSCLWPCSIQHSSWQTDQLSLSLLFFFFPKGKLHLIVQV